MMWHLLSVYNKMTKVEMYALSKENNFILGAVKRK